MSRGDSVCKFRFGQNRQSQRERNFAGNPFVIQLECVTRGLHVPVMSRGPNAQRANFTPSRPPRCRASFWCAEGSGLLLSACRRSAIFPVIPNRPKNRFSKTCDCGRVGLQQVIESCDRRAPSNRAESFSKPWH